MSCTTERMLRRGSVMMEFVIVLPIYMVFLGAVFVVGEMALKAIQLSSADRSQAHEKGDGNWSSGIFSQSKSRQFFEGFVDSVSGVGNFMVADRSIAGPWSQLTAGKATDRYSLPTWTKGWLQALVVHGLDADESWGQVKPITSKDASNARTYNFYTLVRVPGSRGRGYRAWDAKELAGVTGKWTDVWREKEADIDGGSLDSSGGADGRDPTDNPDSRDEYHRYEPFVGWSE